GGPCLRAWGGGRRAGRPHGIASHHSATGVTTCRRLSPSGRAGTAVATGSRCDRRPIRNAEAAHPGELQGRAIRVEAEREAEDVELDAFLPADEDTDEPEDGELDSGPAWSERDRRAARQEVLAHRGGREIEPQLGYRAPDERRERVAVRARPAV